MDPHTLAAQCLESLPRGSVAEQLEHLHVRHIGLTDFLPPPHYLLFLRSTKPDEPRELTILLNIHDAEEARLLYAAEAIAHAFAFSPEKAARYYLSEMEMKRWAAAQGLAPEEIGEFCSNFGGAWLKRHYVELKALLPTELDTRPETAPQ